MMKAERWNVMLVDLKMPGMDGLQVLEEARKLQPEAAVIMMTAYATVDTAVTAMKLGAFDYLVKPFDPEELSLLMQKMVAQQSLVRENAVLRKALKKEHRFRDLVSKSAGHAAGLRAGPGGGPLQLHHPRPRARAAAARRCWPAPSTRRARAPRGPSWPCPARPSPRPCSRASSSATRRAPSRAPAARRKGKFEAADGGTLFLDEIGDISPKLQLDLLRVLEERKFQRVGGNEPIDVDVRIIAATNKDLKKAVADGSLPGGPLLPAQRDPRHACPRCGSARRTSRSSSSTSSTGSRPR